MNGLIQGVKVRYLARNVFLVEGIFHFLIIVVFVKFNLLSKDISIHYREIIFNKKYTLMFTTILIFNVSEKSQFFMPKYSLFKVLYFIMAKHQNYTYLYLFSVKKYL